MRAIFISYRREDAEGQAGRLFDDLARHFGEDSVFMDVAGIEAGRDFRRVIDEHVASCGVLLAMIGKSWVDAKDESGQRRLDDAKDFVRLETSSALKRDIPVIPVLVHGAQMPRAEQLPPDLAELSYRNGVELTHARWDSDVQVLIKALSPHVAVPEGTGLAPVPSKPSAKMSWGMIVAGASALIVVTAGGYTWYQKSTGTTSNLCKELDGKSIDFTGNNNHGVIGPTGIKLEEIGLGAFRFETELVFDEDVIQKFPGLSRNQINGPIEGACHDNIVITLDRTLWDGRIHHYTGQLQKAETGRVDMKGRFQEGKTSYDWFGWTAKPSRK
jgi:hypothetical protein